MLLEADPDQTGQVDVDALAKVTHILCMQS